MKKLLILGIVLIFAPVVSLAQTGTTTSTQATGTTTTTTVADPGLLPGDFFYFLDRWTEALNLALTFNNEKKARKHLEYAKERVAEIDKVLRNPGAKIEDVATAKDNFDAQIADAAALVKSEKDSGSNVSELARELDDELDASRDTLKDILKGHGDESSRAEAEIIAKLATLSPADPQVQGLTQALESITKEKMDTNKEENDLDAGLQDEQALFEDMMGKEMSAQKHIDEAMRLKARLEGLAGQLPAGVVASSQTLLDQAIAAGARGDFETAKRLSKEAKKVFEKAQDAVENNANEMDVKDSNHDGIPDSKDLNDNNDGIPDIKESQNADINGEDVNNLETDIKKTEKMTEGLNR